MRTFLLTEEQKNQLVKRMPRGITLCKVQDIPKIRREPVVHFAYQPPQTYIKTETPCAIQPKIHTDYLHIGSDDVELKREVFVDSQGFPQPSLPPAFSFSQPISSVPLSFIHQNSIKSEVSESFDPPPNLLVNNSSMYSQSSSLNFQRESSMFSQISKASSTISKTLPVYNLDGTKHKSSERLRIIVQRFKKHRKFPQLANNLSKLGQVASLSRIEEEIKRNLHTLDSFKEKVVELLNMMREYPAMTELAEEFHVFLNQLVLMGRQEEFQGNLQEIQKSVDRITRDLTEIKEQGQWYVKKKKRNDRAVDPKELIYICDLIHQLPKCYLVGVWEIVNERPFRQNKEFRQTQVDFSILKPRKIREVQYYVKKKLQNMRKSRENKKAKIDKMNRILHPELVIDNLGMDIQDNETPAAEPHPQTPIFQQNFTENNDAQPQQPDNFLETNFQKAEQVKQNQDEALPNNAVIENPNKINELSIPKLSVDVAFDDQQYFDNDKKVEAPEKQDSNQLDKAPSEIQRLPVIKVTVPKKQPKMNFDDMIDNSSDSSMITDDEDSLD